MPFCWTFLFNQKQKYFSITHRIWSNCHTSQQIEWYMLCLVCSVLRERDGICTTWCARLYPIIPVMETYIFIFIIRNMSSGKFYSEYVQKSLISLLCMCSYTCWYCNVVCVKQINYTFRKPFDFPVSIILLSSRH